MEHKKQTNTCYLCAARPKCEFEKWKVVKNEYPYDRIAETNDILTLKRHTDEYKITRVEQKEFGKIKTYYINSRYDMVLENTKKKKSIPDHYHLHLIVMREPAWKSIVFPQLSFKFLSKALARTRAFVEP